MKLTYSTILILLTSALVLPSVAHAGAESGAYLGAGIGNSNIKGDVGEESFDVDTNGYKLILGYNFGIVPLVDLAIEGSYVDMGEEQVGDLTFSQSSFNGFGLLGLSFGPVGLFAKAGVAAWDAESSIGNLKTTVSGTDPVYGIGARLQIFKVSGRIEFEYYDQSDFDDVYMSSISLLYTF
ncbi:MAG: outer membrane beta-barrel protein [Gammaproteobacteria bacterium]|nr:outer membrane beta-barrel protein [Gammaproteobacteria bacterium]MDX2487215.1 outer membrane beta-barrel protein [Gammaproteobacteria bacterium]